MLVTFCKTCSIFSNAVGSIICTSSKEKVVRINTRRIVAFVKYAIGWIKIAVSKMVGYAMGFLGKTIQVENSISIRQFAGFPNPATAKIFAMFWNRARFVDFFKESFFSAFESLQIRNVRIHLMRLAYTSN